MRMARDDSIPFSNEIVNFDLMVGNSGNQDAKQLKESRTSRGRHRNWGVDDCVLRQQIVDRGDIQCIRLIVKRLDNGPIRVR